MADQRRLPEDGCLPLLPTGVRKSNNIMIVKVPDESGEIQYQLATLDRTLPGTEYIGDKYIDKLIPGLQKVTIYKEPEEELAEESAYNDKRFSRPAFRSRKAHPSRSYKKKPWLKPKIHHNRPRPIDIEPWEKKPWAPPPFHAMDSAVHLENPVLNRFNRPANDFYPPHNRPMLSDLPIFPKGLLGDHPTSNNHFDNNYPMFPTEDRPNNSFDNSFIEEIRTTNASYKNYIPRTSDTYQKNYGRRHGPLNNTSYKNNREFQNDDHPPNFDTETSRMNLNAVPMPRKRQRTWHSPKARNRHPYNQRYNRGRRNFRRSNGARK